MKLYFRNNKGRLNVIAEPSSEKECNAVIKQKLKEYGFTNNFVSIWINPNNGRKVYDFKNYKSGFEVEFNQ